MIILQTGQQVLDTDSTVVTGGNFNDEDNVLVLNEEGQESFLQAYYIEHGVVYAEKTE